MALSQCLDESPLRFCSKRPGTEDRDLQEVYNEQHRLALEQLLSGGLSHFLDFLRKENIPNFLSDDEIQRIRLAAVTPRCPSVHGGDEPGLGQSLCGSVDCSSVTYFPEVSDVEPPLLELGWPAFTAASYRGVTRAVAHFQPAYGDTIYGCKEAARRMIRSSREVIAIVTDSLTDLDIFKDLKEACCVRNIPVYVLLDQACAPAFLKMCRNVGVALDDLRQMRVRTITGTTYFMRSGARITGQVHERFMLIDGNRVATGSYRFNWTDGKLNSSNLVELSGQITEKFDEEFRILYAQSLPINTCGPPSLCNSAIFDHHLTKHLLSSSPYVIRQRPVDHVTSTPNPKLQTSAVQPESDLSADVGHKSDPESEPSTVGEEMVAQEENLQEENLQEENLQGENLQGENLQGENLQGDNLQEENLQGENLQGENLQGDNLQEENLQGDNLQEENLQGDNLQGENLQEENLQGENLQEENLQGENLQGENLQGDLAGNDKPSKEEVLPHPVTSCHASTQTIHSLADQDTQVTEQYRSPRAPMGPNKALPRQTFHSHDAPDLKTFYKLTAERQQHYSAIRTKLERMVTTLSKRRELVDITNMTEGVGSPSMQQGSEVCEPGPNPRLVVENVGVGTWPRARCLH